MEKKYDIPPILNSIFFFSMRDVIYECNTKLPDQPSRPDEVFPLKKPGCSSCNVLFVVKLKKKK